METLKSLDNNLLDRFASIVGPAHAVRDPGAMDPFIIEPRDKFVGSTQMVLRPGSVAEVSAILADRHSRGVPTTVSGARTGITGASVAVDGSAVLSLERLKRLDAPVRDAGGRWTIRAGAGVTLAELNEAVAERSAGTLLFPVDPTETGAAVGGMIATNASGARTYAYGPTRDWVRALTVVPAPGKPLRV